jgi:threonine aldolase
MRAAMLAADVDDDAYGDDPQVGALERRVADLLGKPAALWVPTGTLANQLALALLARPGNAIACTPLSHVHIHEDASAAALAGVQVMPIGSRRGYDVAALEELFDEEACGWPSVAIAWLENTLGAGGGAIWPLRSGAIAGVDGLVELADFAHARGKLVHLDGARLWNAHVATGVPLATYGALADTVSVAMSKGLGAPAGSIFAGSEELIAAARRLKHAYGGAMRQAPALLAAAAMYALDHHVARLADDHRRARTFAAAIADLPCWEVATPDTNIVVARVKSPVRHAERLCAPLRAAGLRCYPNIAREVRFVFHLGIDEPALAQSIAIVHETLRGDPSRFA